MNAKFEEYFRKKEKVLNTLKGIRSNVTDEKIAEKLDKKINQLESDRFVVSVFGHFSNGKSTFLNALMGFKEEVLKVDELASTSTITRLRYAAPGSENFNKAEVIFKDGSRQVRSINDELHSIIAEPSEDGVPGDKIKESVKEVVYYVDSKFLENGVEIVDTPGFNSVYKMHEETAIRQVSESNAAIFMFNCGKPGSETEINFLKKIKRHMDRVFFVLNRCDKSNDFGSEETASIKEKLEASGVDVSNKEFYRISALYAQNAVIKDDSRLLEASQMPYFEEKLLEYLVSGEMERERLYSPLKSAEEIISTEMETVEKQIESCKSEKEEVEKEIRNRSDKIKNEEEELKAKSKTIKKSVESEIKLAENRVNQDKTNLINETKERLTSINSKFRLRSENFDDYALRTMICFGDLWKQEADTLEDKIMEIVDESVDSEDYFNKIKDNIQGVIRSNLKLAEAKDVKVPEFDFSEIDEIDRKIEKADKEYKEAFAKTSSLYAAKEEKEQALEKMKKIESDHRDYVKRRQERIEELQGVKVSKYREKYIEDVYVQRSKIGQAILGPKRVEREAYRDVLDDTELKEAGKKIASIAAEMTANELEYRKHYNDVNAIIAQNRSVDYELHKAEHNSELYFKDLMAMRSNRLVEAKEMEQGIISSEMNRFSNDVCNLISDSARTIVEFLRESKGNFIKIVLSVLDDRKEEIMNQKMALGKIASMNNLPKEELEKIQGELSKQYADYSADLNKIRTLKGEL